MKIANAPCSWGVLEFGLEGEAAGYAQVLDEMQETGYAGTELGDWGFLPTKPELLRNELSARKLHLLGAFVPVALADPNAHADGEAAALRTARLLTQTSGTDAVIVLSDDNGTVPDRTRNAGRIRQEQSLTEEGWKVFAEGAHRIARNVSQRTGLRMVFHHHCAGYVETPEETAKLLELTDPDVLGLCLDTGHYAFGGGDPVEAIRRHGDRIWHVHFKDCDPDVAARSRAEEWDYFESVRQGIFCELGMGSVDFPAVIAALRERRYKGWIVVEQDVLPGMGSPKESARRNRDYLRQSGV